MGGAVASTYWNQEKSSCNLCKMLVKDKKMSYGTAQTLDLEQIATNHHTMKNITDTLNHARHFADNANIRDAYSNTLFNREPSKFSLFMARTFLSRADLIGMTKSEIYDAGHTIAEAWMQSAKVGFYRASRY